jgi:hypothetical protein
MEDQYILSKEGSGFRYTDPDGEQSELFEDHHDCLTAIAQRQIENGDEQVLYFQQQNGEITELPNWNPERWAARSGDDDDYHADDDGDDEPRRARRRRRPVRNRRDGSSMGESRRASPRRRRRGGGGMNLSGFMSSARRVRENVEDLLEAKKIHET